MMMSQAGWKVAGVVVLGAALAAGCARRAEDPVAYGGSIKDDLVAASPAAKPAKPKVRAAVAPAAGAPVASAAAPSSPQAKEPAVAERLVAPEQRRSGAAAAAVAPSAAAPLPAPAAPPRSAAPVPDERETSKQLIEDGNRLFAQGKVMDARRRFIAALSGSSPDATWALGKSFDTHYLSQLPANDGKPDMERAELLYRSAVERDAKGAQEDLDRLLAAKPKQ